MSVKLAGDTSGPGEYCHRPLRQPIPSLMRHLEARGFQDFAKIAKEVAGRVVGAVDFGRRANTTIQVSGIRVFEI